jgi:predicted amidophosphoribosyltransferase
MVALARHVAAALASRGEPAAVARALRLGRGVRDSAGLGAADRVANVHGRVQVHLAGVPPPGTPVVLLDDVVTTGATAAACTEALRHVGLEVSAMLSLTATV